MSSIDPLGLETSCDTIEYTTWAGGVPTVHSVTNCQGDEAPPAAGEEVVAGVVAEVEAEVAAEAVAVQEAGTAETRVRTRARSKTTIAWVRVRVRRRHIPSVRLQAMTQLLLRRSCRWAPHRFRAWGA